MKKKKPWKRWKILKARDKLEKKNGKERKEK